MNGTSGESVAIKTTESVHGLQSINSGSLKTKGTMTAMEINPLRFIVVRSLPTLVCCQAYQMQRFPRLFPPTWAHRKPSTSELPGQVLVKAAF